MPFKGLRTSILEALSILFVSNLLVGSLGRARGIGMVDLRNCPYGLGVSQTNVEPRIASLYRTVVRKGHFSGFMIVWGSVMLS